MVGSPLRLLRRRGSGAARSPLASPEKDQHSHVDVPRGDGAASPATAGEFTPERAAQSEQIVLLLRKPNAGPLTQLGRRLGIWVNVYRMSMAFNCVDPWEQALGNTVVLGGIALVAFVAWREGSRALASAAHLLYTWSGGR